MDQLTIVKSSIERSDDLLLYSIEYTQFVLYGVLAAIDVLFWLIYVIDMCNDVSDGIRVKLTVRDDGMLTVEYTDLHLTDLNFII